MKIVFLLLAITAVKSAPAESCKGSLQLGDTTLTKSTEDATDTTYKTKGLQVLGCGSWMVYERKKHRGSEACIEASHGRMSLNDIGLRRVKSVKRRNSPCPRRAKRGVITFGRQCPNGTIWSFVHQACCQLGLFKSRFLDEDTCV